MRIMSIEGAKEAAQKRKNNSKFLSIIIKKVVLDLIKFRIIISCKPNIILGSNLNIQIFVLVHIFRLLVLCFKMPLKIAIIFVIIRLDPVNHCESYGDEKG